MEKAIAGTQAATNAWADLDNSEMNTPHNGTFSYILKATDQDCKYKVLCSNDGTSWAEDTPETDLTVGTNGYEAGPAFARHYKVQIKEGATPGGSVEACGIAK